MCGDAARQLMYDPSSWREILVKIVRNLLQLLIIISLVSCGKSEIDADIKPVVVKDRLRILKLDYDLEEVEVDSPVRIFSKLPIPFFGGLADTLTGAFIDAFIEISNGHQVSTDKDGDFLEIGTIDRDYITKISISKIQLEYVPKRKKWWQQLNPMNLFKDDFEFIEKIQVYIATDEMLKNNPDLRKLIAFYNEKDKNYTCEKKRCIDLRIPEVNLLNEIQDNGNLYIIPTIEIDGAPNDFILRGKIEFIVETNFDF